MAIDIGEDAEDDQKISQRDIRDAVTDWKKLVTIMFNILAILPVSAFATFMPLIVQGKSYLHSFQKK